MAIKKKTVAKKTATGKQVAKIRNLTNGKRAITAEELETVKGGTLPHKKPEINL